MPAFAAVVELADTKDLKSFGLYPYRFEPGQRHQTSIIRTRFRLAMGSDYCFSLTDTKVPISVMG